MSALPYSSTHGQLNICQIFCANQSTKYSFRQILYWALQFREVTSARFLCSHERRVYLHSIMSDFFLGKWSGGKEKTYRCGKQQICLNMFGP